jgi:DNA-binding HxlR family transcriptional regulator
MSSDTTADWNGSPIETPLFVDAPEILLSVQELLGKKWHPVIVYELLENGPMGFSALKKSVDGISSKMLSESLDNLEAADVVERNVESERPVRVTYSLTERGHELRPVITGMVEWGSDNVDGGAVAAGGR